MMPAGNPKASAMRSDQRASSAETGKDSAMSSLTVRLEYLEDGPRSPRARIAEVIAELEPEVSRGAVGVHHVVIALEIFADLGADAFLGIERAAGREPDHEERDRGDDQEHRDHLQQAAEDEAEHHSIGSSVIVAKSPPLFGPQINTDETLEGD